MAGLGSSAHQALIEHVVTHYRGDDRIAAVAVFGSVSTGAWHELSDVDLAAAPRSAGPESCIRPPPSASGSVKREAQARLSRSTEGEGTVVHVSRRRLVTASLGLLLVTLAAGCSSSPIAAGSSGSGVKAQSEQQLYVARLTRDRQSLDRGVLSYSQLGTLNTAATTQFEVTVTDVGHGPQRVQLTAFNGMNVFQQDVPTGGIVGMQIVRCDNLRCGSESGQAQPVLAKGQQARWWWTVTAGSPGAAQITLRADTYDQGSAQSLSEEIINVGVKVVATPAYNHHKIDTTAKSVFADMNSIGSVASGVVAVGGIAGWVVVVVRRKKKPGNQSRSRADAAG
jgi:hypothetical protein